MADKIKLRNGTAAAWDSADPTLLLGERGLETDTLLAKTGDGSTAWTSLPYDNYGLSAAKSLSYTILDDDANVFEVTTGASDRTLMLPTLADNTDRVIEIHKVDAGAGLVIIDGEGAETIDGVTTIDLDSQYDYARVRAGTASWHLLEYKDHGTESDGEFRRNADGTMEQSDGTDKTITTSNYAEAITFPITFASVPEWVATQLEDISSLGGDESFIDGLITASGFTWRKTGASSALSRQRMWHARGRWRT